MKNTKRLALKRDVLGELSGHDLAGIPAGTVATIALTGPTCVPVQCAVQDVLDEVNGSLACTSVWQCTFGCR